MVTAAKDEARFLPNTLDAVLGQTRRPERWVIVDDGSTDDTKAVLHEAARNHSWICPVSLPPRKDRDFGGKVAALCVASAHLEDTAFDCLGNLDADIEVPPNYYATMLEAFSADPATGIAGGAVFDRQPDGRFVRVPNAPDVVAGAVQLFRRECWEQVGGYLPLPLGGEDAVAEAMARMRGWRVRGFPEIMVKHHRPCGTASAGHCRARFNDGKRDYALGNHPLFQLGKCLYRCGKPPVILSGLLSMMGYAWSAVRRETSGVPREVVRFVRQEQMRRLRAAFFGNRKETSLD